MSFGPVVQVEQRDSTPPVRTNRKEVRRRWEEKESGAPEVTNIFCVGEVMKCNWRKQTTTAICRLQEEKKSKTKFPRRRKMSLQMWDEVFGFTANEIRVSAALRCASCCSIITLPLSPAKAERWFLNIITHTGVFITDWVTTASVQ